MCNQDVNDCSFHFLLPLIFPNDLLLNPGESRKLEIHNTALMSAKSTMNSDTKYDPRAFKYSQNSGFVSETLGRVEGRTQGWDFHIKANVSAPEGPAQTCAIYIINS